MTLSLSEKINLGIDILNTKKFFHQTKIVSYLLGTGTNHITIWWWFFFFGFSFEILEENTSIHKPMVAIDGVGIITIVRLCVCMTCALVHMGTLHATMCGWEGTSHRVSGFFPLWAWECELSTFTHWDISLNSLFLIYSVKLEQEISYIYFTQWPNWVDEL